MSISVNYILEQERNKKLQQQQQDTPAIEAPAQQQVQHEGELPLEQQLEKSKQADTGVQDFAEKYPIVRKAYNESIKPKNESMLPPPEVAEPALMEQLPTEAPQAPQEEISNKPSNWTDEEYNAVRQLYTDEQIQSIYSKPDPNEFLNGIISQIYKNNTPEPIEPDEKEMKRQTRYAAIGDALGLLSQAAGLSMGAHQKERSFEQSAMAQLTKNQQRLYDNYLQRADQYNRGAVNAYMQDYIKGEKDWKDTQKEVGRILDTQRKEKMAQAKQDQLDALNRDKLEETKKRNEAYAKSIDARIEDLKERAATGRMNAATQARLAEARIMKLEADTKAVGASGTSTGKKPEYQVAVPAHPTDTLAEELELGNPVRVFNMTNAQRNQYTRDAIADEDFMERHPEFALDWDKKTYTDAQKKDIADAYVQDIYNKKYQSSEHELDATIPATNQFKGNPPNIITKDPVEVVKDTIQSEIDVDEEFPIIF